MIDFKEYEEYELKGDNCTKRKEGNSKLSLLRHPLRCALQVGLEPTTP